MFPSLTVEQMRHVDELAVEKFNITVPQLMENAGHRTAAFIRDKTGIKGKRITILAGKGNNGGDGLAAARFLKNWGAKVIIILADKPSKLNSITKYQLEILKAMKVKILYPICSKQFQNTIKRSGLIIDALIGYSLKGNPLGMYAELVNVANASKEKILAVDVPTGLDADTGEPYEPCIKARWTLTPKKGLLEKKAQKYVGELWVADIGIPNEIYRKLGVKVPNIFAEKDIMRA